MIKRWLDWLFDSTPGGWILCTFAWVVVFLICAGSWTAVALVVRELVNVYIVM